MGVKPGGCTPVKLKKWTKREQDKNRINKIKAERVKGLNKLQKTVFALSFWKRDDYTEYGLR